jgi:two-component system CheB/CheR fusion protein
MQTRAFELNDVPQIVLDQERHLILANRRARDLFGLTEDDLGKPVQDLELSHQPIDLGSQIDKAVSGDTPVLIRSARWERDGETSYWDITVAVLNGRDTPRGLMIALTDVTARYGMEEELQRLQREVQKAYGELKSTVEELETTNEELQSSNEELETMNEELQSTNEELETINAELRQRSTELDEVNVFFESVLAREEAGVALTDAHLRVRVWNHQAENLWGLRSDEAHGHDLLSLDIGLPVAELREPAEAVVAGRSKQEDRVLEATSGTGRIFRCTVSITPLAQGPAVQGLIVVMTAQDPQSSS